ncbi:MAG: SUMF1/EgtB/PvdO family nonheme iron enzyme [Muribaculaceae bacterium]|nr:SUMF1/EgtB/PvdO family nonheme iron enzyme [Muribaculaceae bacterium]
MKRIYKQLIALAALVCMPTMVSATTGDVTGDGAADIDDVNMIINQMLGFETGLNCDANGDGSVDVDDLNLVINVLLGLVPDDPGVTPEDEVFTVEGVTFKMIYVEGGTFQMGGRDLTPIGGFSTKSNLPGHQVTVSSFKIMETECIQALYYALMPENCDIENEDEYYYRTWKKWRDDAYPAECVKWDNAVLFAQKLSELTGRTFRLPTEAEWEWAAKGGVKSEGYLYSGSDDIYQVGNVHFPSSSPYEQTLKVPKTKAPNELGLYDMTGNQMEWTNDVGYLYSEDEQVNPEHGGGYMMDFGTNSADYRVLRGGSRDYFNYMWALCANEGRGALVKTSNQPGNGFRLVLVN